MWLNTGSKVAATRRLVSAWRGEVPEGTRGRVIETGGMFRPIRGTFTVSGWFSSKDIILDVKESDIRKV